MIDIRPLHKDEIPAARGFVPLDAAEPDWINVWAVFDGVEMVGIFGMEQRIVVEPLYMRDGRYSQGIMSMSWIDGFLRAHATALGRNGYEFFVGNDNEKFQHLVERHMPVSKGREKPGLYYFRKFEV